MLEKLISLVLTSSIYLTTGTVVTDFSVIVLDAEGSAIEPGEAPYSLRIYFTPASTGTSTATIQLPSGLISDGMLAVGARRLQEEPMTPRRLAGACGAYGATVTSNVLTVNVRKSNTASDPCDSTDAISLLVAGGVATWNSLGTSVTSADFTMSTNVDSDSVTYRLTFEENVFLTFKMQAADSMGWTYATYQIWSLSNPGIGEAVDLTLTLGDSMMNGWMGVSFTLQDDDSGAELLNGSMSSGISQEVLTHSTSVGTRLNFTVSGDSMMAMYVSWELSIDGNSIYEVLESASDVDKLTSVVFTMPGSMITDSSLASGAQTTEVHEVQPGETLAFSVLKGETTMTSNIQWEFAEQDGTVIGSAEYMTSDSLKFPLLETFVVAGPAKCIQTIVSEFKPYSSEADFITNTHKYLFADEDYIYFVSDTMTLFRVDKATLSQVTSLTLTSSSYVMGFVFDSYGYLIPSSGSPSRFPIASFDSISDVSLTNTPGWSTAVLYDNGVTNYAILIPRAGVMTILNLDSWTFEREFDDSNYYYYSDGFVADDGNCYMVPYQDSMASASGLLARFNLARAVTGSRTIESVDLTGLSDANAYNWNGFTAGLQDLTYGYLIKDGLVVRFRLANLNDITEISLSNSASPVARALKVGDYFHFLMADSDVWETWSLLNGRSSTVNLAGSGSWISLDAVFAGDYIYVYGDETGVRKMRTICQAWRSRTEAIRSCDAEVTTYGASSDLTTLLAGASFSDDVHLYYMSSGTELTRILLETENDVLNVATLTYPNSGSGYQFNGGFHDGVYGYLVPGAATMVFRFDLETFSGGTFLDLADIGATGNCKDGFALNGYGYLLPQNGIVFRLNLSSFVSSAVEQLDLTLTDTNFVKFSGGINDGTYGYLAPYQTGSGTSFGNLVQFRLDPLEYVSQIDLSTVYSGLGQFEGIFSDGTYGYLYGGSHYRIVRFTLGTLSTANVMLLANRNGQHTMTGSLMSNTSAVLSYLYNSGLERLNLIDYTLASSDLTVDQFVSSWLDAQPTDTYELYMRSTSNYSQFYKICEVTASSSCNGQVLKRTVTDTSGFYGSFNVLFADGMSAYLLSSSTSYFFKVELSTMGSQYINQYQGTMSGGFAEGDYLYALPESSISNVLRTINASFSYPATSELTHSLSNVAGGFSDGTYGYLVPSSGGQLGRFNLQTFAMDPSTPTDLTSVHSDLSSFSGGFHDGTYGYLVPDKDGVLSASGRVVRFNLASFSGFEVLDVSNNGAFSARQQFIDGFTDFSYGFLIAGGFGRTKAIVRFSLSDFTLASVEEATVSLISSGSFVRGLRRVRYGYIFNDDGAVIKFHLKTLEQERLKAVASNVWAAFLDASGTFWMASTANSYKDFYSLCQDSLPFVNVHITCNSTAEKLTVTDESIDWVSMTFNSMMTDGIYAYLVPSTGDTALRLPLSDYGSAESLSFEGQGLTTTYWTYPGFMDDNYGYFASDTTGEVARFDLATFSQISVLDMGTAVSTRCQMFSGGFADDSYGYLTPQFNGVVCRFDLSTFGTASMLDLSSYDSDIQHMNPGFQLNGYAYLAPSTGMSGDYGKLLRFETASFSSVTLLDLTTTDASLKKFSAAFTDGTDGYLVPGGNGKAVRFSLDASNFAVLDFRDVSSWSLSAKGGFSDGNYIYLYGDAKNNVLRMDWSNSQNEELMMDSGVTGFYGGFVVQKSLFFFDTTNPEAVWRMCQPEASSSSTCEGQITEQTVVDGSGFFSTYSVSFADGLDAYFLDSSQSYIYKVDLTSMSSSNVFQSSGSMNGGFVEGDYLYGIASQKVLRVYKNDLTSPSPSELTTPVFFVAGGFSDGTYGYLVPSDYGLVGRFNLQSFAMDPATAVDLTTINADAAVYKAGFHNGMYGFLVPHQTSSATASGLLVRFELASFSNFEILDLTESNTYTERQQFIDGFTDFTDGFLVPDVAHGRTLVRFSLRSFNKDSITTKDLSTVSNSAGSFLKGVARVRYGYIFNSDGSVLKIHLQTLDAERLVVTSNTVYGGLLDSSGHIWALSESNSGKDFFKLCQDTVPYVDDLQISCTSTVEELTAANDAVNWGISSFTDVITDNIYAYFIPTVSSSILRISLSNYSAVDILPPGLAANWQKGFSDGSYGYMVPNSNGVVVRFDFASFSTVESFDIDAVAGSSAGRCQQFSGGFDDGTYGYLIPNQYGEICRFQLSNFGGTGSTGYLNLQSTDGDLQGMRPGFQAKGYGYLAPHTSSSSTSLGKMVRFNLASFSSVSVVDLTTVSSDLKRFSSAITDDTYGYLIPDENGKVVRFDLDPFALSDTKDITFWSSSANGFSDGSYLYLYSSSVSDVLRMDWENNQNELITLASGGYGVSMSVYAAFAAQSSLFFFNSFNYQVAYRLCQEVPGTSTTTSSSSSTSSTSTSSSSTSSTSTSSSTTSSSSSTSSTSTTSSTTSSSSSSSTSTSSSTTSSSSSSSTSTSSSTTADGASSSSTSSTSTTSSTTSAGQSVSSTSFTSTSSSTTSSSSSTNSASTSSSTTSTSSSKSSSSSIGPSTTIVTTTTSSSTTSSSNFTTSTTVTTTTYLVSGNLTQTLIVVMRDSSGTGWNGGKFVVRNHSTSNESTPNVDIFVVMDGPNTNSWASASYSIRLASDASAKYNGTITNGGLTQTDRISEAVGEILYLTVQGVTTGMSWDIRDDRNLNIVSSQGMNDPNVQDLRFRMPGQVLWEETLRSGTSEQVTFPVMLGDDLSISLVPPVTGGIVDLAKLADMGIDVYSVNQENAPMGSLFISTEATLAEKGRVVNRRFPVWPMPDINGDGGRIWHECYQEQGKSIGYQELNRDTLWHGALDGFGGLPFSDGPFQYFWAQDRLQIFRHYMGEQIPLSNMNLPTSVLPTGMSSPNFVTAFSWREYSYLLSSTANTGVLLRFHESFQPSEVATLDLTSVSTSLVDFTSAFTHGSDAYLVPGPNGGILPRIDLQTFQVSGQLNLLNIDADYKDFVAGVSMGDHGVLVPKRNKLVRVKLSDFTTSVLDFTSFTRLRNFQAAFKGTNDDVYLVPGPAGLAAKVTVKTLALKRLDLRSLSPEGYKGGAIHTLFETGYFVGAYGVVVRFHLKNFTIDEEFQAVSSYYWDVAVRQVQNYGRYGVVYFTQNTEHAYLMACEQEAVQWIGTPVTMMTFSAVGMENVSYFLRNATEGAGLVQLTMRLENQGTVGGGGTIFTVSNSAGDLQQLSLPSGSQETQVSIANVTAGSKLFVTVSRGADLVDENDLSWVLYDDTGVPLTSSSLSSVGRWPSAMPVDAPGVLVHSDSLERGRLSADFWVRVTDALTISFRPDDAGVNLSMASWGLYDHHRDPIVKLKEPRTFKELVTSVPFDIRNGETIVPVFSTTSTNTTTTSRTITTTETSTSSTGTSVTTSSSTQSKTTSTSLTTTTLTSTSSSATHTSTSSSSFTVTSTSRTFSSTSTFSTSSTTRTTSSSTSTSSSSTSQTSSSSTMSSTTSTTITISSSTRTSSSSTSSSTTSTSSSTTSSTSTTTLEGAFVVPNNVDAATPQGSVVQASLQTALVALNSEKESIVQVTPQGTVTVKKVVPTELSSGLVFEINASDAISLPSAVTVQVPSSAAIQAADGKNLMVSLTQVTQDVTQEMPARKDTGDTVQYQTGILEFSFLQEAGGLITVANLENATEPIYFRFKDTPPVEGDSCAFFDFASNRWSFNGLTLINGSNVPAFFDASGSQGTWCSSTHTSIFALVQLIPFNETADQQDGIINANGATVASAMMIIFCCCALCPVVAIFLRRMKPAAAGKTEIKDSKGNLFVVNYQRTEVIEETKTIHDDENEEVEEKKKVLVKWDIDVAAMMRRLNTLRGHRWVSMDLAANRIKETPTMTKECSKSITKRNLARSEVSGEDERDEDGKMMSTMQTQRSEVFGPMESMKTESDVEVSPTAVAVNATIPPEREDEQKSETIEVVVDDVLDAVWREIYQDRAPVSYWSVTHQRLIQGFIVGKGIADDSSATSSEDIKLPCYDVRVGVRNQYRHAVPVMHLEPSLQVNESVHVWVETFREWKRGRISNCLHSAGMYQVMVFPHRDDDDFPEDMQDPLVIDNVSLERLRRRFAKNTPVLIYRGLNVGWFHAMIVEDVIQDLQPPAVMSPRDMFITPRKIDKRPEATLSTEDRETSEDQEDEIQPTVAVAAPSEVPNTIVQVKIRVAGADEVEEVPSYLISVIPEILAV